MTKQDLDTAIWWLRKLIRALADACSEWQDGGAAYDTDKNIRRYSQHIAQLPGGEELANQAWSCGAYSSTLLEYYTARDAAQQLLDDLTARK